MAGLQNKELKLTKPGTIGASQLDSSVGQTLELELKTKSTFARVAFVPAVMVACIAMATSGCGHSQPSDIIERAGGAERLREAALSLRSNAPGDGSEAVVPMGDWPEAFRMLSPEVVSVDREGVDVTLKVDTFYASGLRVCFDVSMKPKDLGEDLSFDQIVPGIYWYRMVMGG
jgi:hypothetical protein